jgi:hypothetical protein
MFEAYWEVLDQDFSDLFEEVHNAKAFCELRMTKDLQKYVPSFRLFLQKIPLPARQPCIWFKEGLLFWLQDKVLGFVEQDYKRFGKSYSAGVQIFVLGTS